MSGRLNRGFWFSAPKPDARADHFGAVPVEGMNPLGLAQMARPGVSSSSCVEGRSYEYEARMISHYLCCCRTQD